MRTAAATIVLALLSLAATSRAETGESHVKVDLLADTTAVQPGKPFTLGVRFKIDPGWHIYWTNPGDSGLPTRVKLDLPAGYKAGDVQYPVPEVMKLPGDITNYGYEHEVMLLVPVTPPADAKGAAEIAAQASYLVCAENCLPGRDDAHLTVPVGRGAASSGDAFPKWTERLPAPRPTGVRIALVRKPAPNDAAYQLRINWGADVSAVKSVDWLPPLIPGFDLTDVRTATKDGVTELDYKLTPTGKEPLPSDAQGLIVYERADGRRIGFAITILPAQSPGSTVSELGESGH